MRRALALAALLGAVGCGVKAPPRPPIDPKDSGAAQPAATEQGRER